MTIVGITAWEEDLRAEAGDASHMGEFNVRCLALDEYERKVEKGEWPGLPFTCDTDDLDEALERYNAAFCEFDYFRATDAEV